MFHKKLWSESLLGEGEGRILRKQGNNLYGKAPPVGKNFKSVLQKTDVRIWEFSALFFFLYNPGPQILGPGRPGSGIPTLGPERAQTRNSFFGQPGTVWAWFELKIFVFHLKVVSRSPTYFPIFILCGLRPDRKTNKRIRSLYFAFWKYI